MGSFRDNARGGFNRGSSRGGSRGRNGFGGGFGGGRDRGERRPLQMYDVVCSKCGISTQVPFKPTGTRPVLCRDCFSQNAPGNFSSNSRSNGAPSSAPSQNNSGQFAQLNAKLDKIIAVLAQLELVRDDSDMEDELEDEEESEDVIDSHKGHKHPHADNDKAEDGENLDELSEGIKREFEEDSEEDDEEDSNNGEGL